MITFSTITETATMYFIIHGIASCVFWVTKKILRSDYGIERRLEQRLLVWLNDRKAAFLEAYEKSAAGR